ncbi:erg10, acetyl-CoA C-acetyltransferase [Sorochytrium milnesiophthora]
MTMTIADNGTHVFIVSTARTPIGGYNGSLASFSAVELGSLAAKAALQRAQVQPDAVEEVYFGNVLMANNGQNPARQVSVRAGLPVTVPATSINKVCASGMKAMSLASQSIRLGLTDVALAGGTESMSNAPHYLPRARFGLRYGNGEIIDACVQDGLTDAFDGFLMGSAAEHTVKEYNLTRQEQDDYAISSYQRAQRATADGKFVGEIVPIEVAQGRGKLPKVVNADDEVSNLQADKMRTLKPLFGMPALAKQPPTLASGPEASNGQQQQHTGSVTAANASPLSDGAAAMVLVSGKKLKEMQSAGQLATDTPVFRLLSCADAEQDPVRFTTTPSLAVPKALRLAGLSHSDISFYELNEAFACVALANCRIMQLDPAKVNVYGGAVAMGHPLGCSGARIVVTLCNVLQREGGKYGVAGICNGGGGASACVIERVAASS